MFDRESNRKDVERVAQEARQGAKEEEEEEEAPAGPPVDTLRTPSLMRLAATKKKKKKRRPSSCGVSRRKSSGLMLGGSQRMMRRITSMPVIVEPATSLDNNNNNNHNDNHNGRSSSSAASSPQNHHHGSSSNGSAATTPSRVRRRQSIRMSHVRLPSFASGRKTSSLLAVSRHASTARMGADFLPTLGGPMMVEPANARTTTTTSASSSSSYGQGRGYINMPSQQQHHQHRMWARGHPELPEARHHQSRATAHTMHHAAQQRDTHGVMLCRMPWHDTHCSVLGMAALDTAKCFVQAWNAICGEIGVCIPIWPYSELQQLVNADSIIERYELHTNTKQSAVELAAVDAAADVYLDAVDVDDDIDDAARGTVPGGGGGGGGDADGGGGSHRKKSGFHSGSRSRAAGFAGAKEESTRSATPSATARKHPSLDGFSACNVQVLRSLSKWSGWRSTENSIMKAYLNLIKHAERFVYIENQFFMSTSSHKSHNISNAIGAAIQERVVRAIRKREQFRVIIVVPTHHDGCIEDKIIQTLLMYMQRCLSQGNRSLIFQIQREIQAVAIEEARRRKKKFSPSKKRVSVATAAPAAAAAAAASTPAGRPTTAATTTPIVAAPPNTSSAVAASSFPRAFPRADGTAETKTAAAFAAAAAAAAVKSHQASTTEQEDPVVVDAEAEAETEAEAGSYRLPTVDDYLTILSLHRWEQHPQVSNVIGHSQIYVHSKLLIVDDKHLVMGLSLIHI